jgi:hypothetical protein
MKIGQASSLRMRSAAPRWMRLARRLSCRLSDVLLSHSWGALRRRGAAEIPRKPTNRKTPAKRATDAGPRFFQKIPRIPENRCGLHPVSEAAKLLTDDWRRDALAARDCLQPAKEVSVTTVAVLATANGTGRRPKGWRIRQLTQEIGDASRCRSGVREMSRISSPAARDRPAGCRLDVGGALHGEVKHHSRKSRKFGPAA